MVRHLADWNAPFLRSQHLPPLPLKFFHAPPSPLLIGRSYLLGVLVINTHNSLFRIVDGQPGIMYTLSL